MKKAVWSIALAIVIICILFSLSAKRIKKAEVYFYDQHIGTAIAQNKHEYYIPAESLKKITQKKITLDEQTGKVLIKNIVLNEPAKKFKEKWGIPLQEAAAALRYEYNYDNRKKKIFLVKKPPALYEIGDRIQYINSNKSGDMIDIDLHRVPGKFTIFCFFSQDCPVSARIKPFFQDLVIRRYDVVVKYVDIDRPEVRGIDYSSPVALYYGIHAVPYIKIFDHTGRLITEGKPAKQMLNDMMKEAYEE